MAQDTRKDPRAKVLSMTVRYKSATVDQFIEQHSHDVSRGGIYIKTPSPFPPGTLLKFEIRIQDEQSVLSGVGRVVWKREPTEASGDSPAGMGVKFIKIEEKHKDLIARLVESQGGKVSAFDAGVDGGAAAAKEAATAAVAALAESAKQQVESKPAAKRVSTMLGLGAIGRDDKKADDKKADAHADAEPEKKEESGGFFPKSTTPAEQRPAEERTVMKQAAELLQQALSEAGGSLSDVAPDEPKVVEAKSEAKSEPKDEPKKENGAAALAKTEVAPKASKSINETAPMPEEDSPVAPKAAAKEVDRDEVESKPVAEEKPAAKPAAKPEPKVALPPVSARSVEPEKSGGGAKFIILGLALAAILGVAYFVVSKGDGTSPTASNSAAKPPATMPPMQLSTQESPSKQTASQAVSSEPPPQPSTPATESAAPATSSAAPVASTAAPAKSTAPVAPPTVPVTAPRPPNTPATPNTTPKPPTTPPTTPKPPQPPPEVYPPI
ncbi:MAG: TIGR02266 family protein [Polyangiaceae bacterium]